MNISKEVEISLNKEMKIAIETVENGQGLMGIVFGDKTRIILPKYYMDNCEKTIGKLSSTERRKLKMIVRAWKKYQSRVSTKNNGSCLQDGANYDFDTVFRIVQDYIENGLYIEFEYVGKMRRNGKIEFSKTIKNCKPIVTEQGAVYLSYITKTKKISDEDLLRDVQTLVLNDIAATVGWLIGFNLKLPYEGINISLSKSTITKLKIAKRNSFNSRKIKLIEYLIKYITMVAGDQPLGNEYFVSVAYKFWEDMITVTMGNVGNKELNRIFYIRHCYFNKKTGKVVNVMDPLMPDAVYRNNQNLVILDAKYYNEGFLPQNNDITKQFAYMKKAYEYWRGTSITKYRNVFVLPTNKPHHYSDLQACFDENITSEKELMPIDVLYLNFEEMVENYLHTRNLFNLVL